MTLPRPYLSVQIIFSIFMKWRVPYFSAWTSEVLLNMTWPLSPFTSDLMWNGHNPWIADFKVSPITSYQLSKNNWSICFIFILSNLTLHYRRYCYWTGCNSFFLLNMHRKAEVWVLHQFCYICYVYDILVKVVLILSCII